MVLPTLRRLVWTAGLRTNGQSISSPIFTVITHAYMVVAEYNTFDHCER